MSFTEQGGEADKGALLSVRLLATMARANYLHSLHPRALRRLVNLLEYFMILPAKETAVCIGAQRSARRVLNTSIWTALAFKGLFTQGLQFACGANRRQRRAGVH